MDLNIYSKSIDSLRTKLRSDMSHFIIKFKNLVWEPYYIVNPLSFEKNGRNYFAIVLKNIFQPKEKR